MPPLSDFQDVITLEDGSREVIFKAMYWNFEESGDDPLTIYVAGRTKGDKSVFVRIDDFKPSIYVSLPDDKKWSSDNIKKVFERFKTITRKHAPIEYETLRKYNLYGKVRKSVMLLRFNSHNSAKTFGYGVSRIKPFYLKDIGMISGEDMQSFEHNIDPLIKFTALRNINPAGWMKVTEVLESNIPVEDRAFSECDIDVITTHDNVSSVDVDTSISAHPTYLAFDIECYSVNHNSRLPDATISKNVVFQIGIVEGKLLNKESRRKKLLTLFDPHDIPGVEIVRFDKEKSLLLDGFRDEVNKEKPDVFIGYNTMQFDWDYMIKRSQDGGFFSAFMKMSKLVGRKANLGTVNWNSSAYGDQKFNYVDPHGSTQMDAIIEVQRNYRLPSYALNPVAKRFLDDEKDDITPQQLFMLYKVTYEFLEKSKTMTNKQIREEFYPRIREIMNKRKCGKSGGMVRKLRRKLLTCTKKNITDTIRECLTLTGEYCIQDTVLSVDLVEHLNMLTTMGELAGVMSVPFSYLHTRGQQIKVLSQIFRECLVDGIIIPCSKDGSKIPEGKYQGAIVVKAIPGVYILVGVLDFASLYPTTMIIWNICYTTLLKEGEEWPAEKTHFIAWEEHIGCEHDLLKRKKKKEDVLCGSHSYRFKKVEIIIEEDGTVKYINEGLMPRLEKNLLGNRSRVKKEMFKCQARLDMHLGVAEEDDIKFFRSIGFEIISKGALSSQEESILRMCISVLNAKQLAIKISANSVSKSTPVPCLVNGEVKFMKIEDLFTGDGYHHHNTDEVRNGPEGVKVWSDAGWASIKYVIRKKVPKGEKMYRITTEKGYVEVSGEHSLLSDWKFDDQEVKGEDVYIGDSLLHHPVPLPEDVQEHPQYTYPDIQKIFADGDWVNLKDSFLARVFENYDENVELSDTKKAIVLSTNDQVEACELWYLARSLGYYTSLTHTDKFYIECYSDNRETDDSFKITGKVEYTPEEDEYIYDIETSTHHFAAGVGDINLHNSAYGGMGAKTGFIPFIPGAACVTAMGREQITRAVQKIEQLFPDAEVVYGDTDSCMVRFPGKNRKETFDACKLASKLVTHYLKCWAMGVEEEYEVSSYEQSKDGKEVLYSTSGELIPKKYRLNEVKPVDEAFKYLSNPEKIKVLEYARLPLDLELEKIYGVMMLLSKKRYFATIINSDGEVTGFDKKGCVLTRRDNNDFLKGGYKKLADMIVKEENGEYFIKKDTAERDIMYNIYDKIHTLFTRQVPDTHLIIYMGVKNVLDYAVKKKIYNRAGELIGEPYVDDKGDPIDDVVGPLDPRLVYGNYPQCLLALKMIRRGTTLPANVRLEFVYCENPDAVRQGEKAEDYSFYSENKDELGLKIDKLHYIEKYFCKPVGELIGVLFPRENIPYEKLEDRFKRLLGDARMDPLKRARLFKARRVMKDRPKKGEKPFGKIQGFTPSEEVEDASDEDIIFLEEEESDEYFIGWKVLKIEGVERKYTKVRGYPSRVDKSFEGYTERAVLDIRAEYIIQSTLSSDVYRFSDEDPFEKELIIVAKRWKCRSVLNRMYRQHSLTIRQSRRAKQTGDSLFGCKEVMVTTPISPKIGVGKILSIVTTHKIEDPKGGKKHTYEFDLGDEETEEIFERIPRSSISSFYERDGKVLKDILEFRGYYKQLVDELNVLFKDIHAVDILF